MKKLIHTFDEFHAGVSLENQQSQASRCMSCGVPFCQSGMTISGMTSGCPLNNLVPEINDLVSQGNWEQAYQRLQKTHCFPEFTSRVCPALCEAACTCGLHDKPVPTKENEKAVIEYAFEHGLVEVKAPKIRTGKTVAIVGSGPAGLAAALQLNRRGHKVTVYERSDRVGGLLRYGIPNMKLDKSVIDRRIKMMEKAGVTFVCNTNIGVDISAEELMQQYDRVILACGASKPRDINVPGRDAEGIRFAVDFLTQVTKELLDSGFQSVPYDMVKDKNVLVIGGGDTGNDCVGTAIRLGAKSVMQLEMMPQAPEERLPGNPWPEWPKVLKTDYGQREAMEAFGADPRRYETTVTEFLKDENGHVCGAKIVKVKRENNKMVPVPGSEETVAADFVLIAAGFLGSEGYITDDFGVECNERTNVKTEPGSYETNVERVFTAGDMHRGQSLVVWAISEGKQAAKQVDASLMGYTNL
ncbi:MAG: glutamate synthase subunit beta [Lachnospiraceae bacterium]